MSAARVLVEQPEALVVVQDIARETTALPETKTDRELLVIFTIAVVIAFTFTVSVIGSILIALALRGSGVMGNVWTRVAQIGC